MVVLRSRRRKIISKKRNIFLLALCILILAETSILVLGLISEERESEFVPNKFSFSSIPTAIETTTSSVRFKMEMAFAEGKTIDIYETAKDEKKLRYLLGALGPQKAMAILLENTKGGALQDCHQQAHTIGRVSYRVYKAKALLDVSYDCHSGYLHGAIEEFLKETGTEDIARNIDNMCNALENGFSKFECLHGSGHGMMVFENYDLPAAINDCKKLHTEYAQSSCYGGVFMENIIAAQGLGGNGHATKWVSRDPHFPCTKFPALDDISYQCYLIQTAWMLTLHKYDFKLVAEECMKAVEGRIAVCYRSMGRDIAGYVLRDTQGILDKCSYIIDKKYYKDCIQGAAAVVVEFWGPKLDMQGVDFCKQVEQREGRKICFSTVASQMHMLSMEQEKMEKICREFEPSYQHYCN